MLSFIISSSKHSFDISYPPSSKQGQLSSTVPNPTARCMFRYPTLIALFDLSSPPHLFLSSSHSYHFVQMLAEKDMALLTALMAVVDNSNPEVINNVAKSLVCYSPLPPPFPPLSFSPFPSLALSFFPLSPSLPLFLPPSLPHCYICRRICWKTRGCSCSGLMLCCARKLRTAVSRERGERAGRERGESGERAGRARRAEKGAWRKM